MTVLFFFIFVFSLCLFLFSNCGNHDESSALATQCETPCATRLSYHGICTILRAIGTIYVIRKCPIFGWLFLANEYVIRSTQLRESRNVVKEFVSRRAEKLGEKAPKVFNVKIFEPKSETRSARLTVAEGDAALLRSPNFWPRPIYARLWNFDFVSKPSLCREDSGSEKEGHEPVKTENDNTASGPSTSSQWRRPGVLPRNHI